MWVSELVPGKGNEITVAVWGSNQDPSLYLGLWSALSIFFFQFFKDVILLCPVLLLFWWTVIISFANPLCMSDLRASPSDVIGRRTLRAWILRKYLNSLRLSLFMNTILLSSGLPEICDSFWWTNTYFPPLLVWVYSLTLLYSPTSRTLEEIGGKIVNLPCLTRIAGDFKRRVTKNKGEQRLSLPVTI